MRGSAGHQGAGLPPDTDDILTLAYWQITSNPVYSSVLAALVLVAVAYAKARAQQLLANALLTQVTLDRSASRRLRHYASFQLQDSAFVTQITDTTQQGEIQDFKSYEMERLAGSQPQTVTFRMGEQSTGHFWVPDLRRIAPPSETPTLRGAPLGNGPSRRVTVVLLIALVAGVVYCGLVARTLTGADVALRLVWTCIIPIALVSWTDHECRPCRVNPTDSPAVSQLAGRLRRFYQEQAQAGTSELRRAAAKVELHRAARDPEHFHKKAQKVAQDPTGLDLPQEIRAVFNVDLDGTPCGYGYGTWMSWLLPVVWIIPPDQKYPSWMAKLPVAVQRHAKELYDKLFAIPDPVDAALKGDPRAQQWHARQQQRAEKEALEIVTLCCFAWHKTTLIQLLIDQADDLQRIKANDNSVLNYNGATSDQHGEGTEARWLRVSGPPRRMETITLGPEAQELRSDVESFLSPAARELFRQRLLPYQRCYLLHGPPGNGKSSVLQALSIKFELALYFLKVSKGMTKTDLERLLKPLRNNVMICIEDAESAFPSDMEIEKREEEARAAQLVADRAPSAQPDDGAGDAGGRSNGAKNTQQVSAKVFVDLIKGEGVGAPEKRLIFFSTNHVTKMPLEIKQLCDQQGARTEFPNCTRAMTARLFNLFFPEEDFQQTARQPDVQPATPDLARQISTSEQRARENCTAKELRQVRADFLAAVEAADWFHGFEQSNIAGASLSEYFQRHRDNPAMAVSCVSGDGINSLQGIVERSQPSQLPASPKASPRPQDDDASRFDMDGVDGGAVLRRTLSVRALSFFGLSGIYMLALTCVPLYTVVAVEMGVRRQPVAMGVLALVLTLAHALSIGLMQKLTCSVLLALVCSLDCDGDASVWGADPLDDTLLCVQYGLSTVKQNQYWSEYVEPKLEQAQTEAWAAVPMAMCTCIFVVVWLSLDFFIDRCSSFLWLRFRIRADAALSRYAREGLQREYRASAPRVVLRQLEDVQDKVGVPKLRTINHDADSVASAQYRKVTAQIDNDRWSALPHRLTTGSTATIWMSGLQPPDKGASRRRSTAQNAEFRVWRWGASWLPWYSQPEPRDIMFDFLQEQRRVMLQQTMLEPASIQMMEHPVASSGNDDRRQHIPDVADMESCVPVGGLSSFVWPEAPAQLFDLFHDALEFQTSANRRWYMKRGIPFRRGYFIHGPPKCGKTHWVKLLARHLGAELHIINLADPLMTDELLIDVFQGEDKASQHSVILIKGAEQVVQYRTCLNPKLTYTTLLNVLDGPFARTDGCISVISCSDFEHFQQDTTSVDALLRPGRIAKQVEFERVISAGSTKIEDMFCMMLGTTASDLNEISEVPSGTSPERPSQFNSEQNETVLAMAVLFKRNWTECFEPESPTATTPLLGYTLFDVKNYLSQFFIGQQTWSTQEISAKHRHKLEQAVQPESLLECKHRMMELRREVKAKLVSREPTKLAALQRALKDKDETSGFFDSRLEQSRELLAELAQLAPEEEHELPVFDRRYRRRTAKEAELIAHLTEALALAEAGEAIVGRCLGVEEAETPVFSRSRAPSRGRGRGFRR